MSAWSSVRIALCTPAVVGAIMVATGVWRGPGVFNIEQLDPDPFLELLPRFGVRRAVAIGGLLTLSGGTLVGALAWAGLHSTWAILVPYYLYMLGHAIHQPCSQSGAVGPFLKRGRPGQSPSLSPRIFSRVTMTRAPENRGQSASLEQAQGELVLGLTAAVGTDLDAFERLLPP